MIECEPNLINDCPLGFDITPKLSLQVCKRNVCLVGYRKECFDTINKLVLNEKKKISDYNQSGFEHARQNGIVNVAVFSFCLERNFC